MSILLRLLGDCLAAIIAVGLLLGGATAAPTPCGDQGTYGATTHMAPELALEPANAPPPFDARHDPSYCCPAVAAGCCAGALATFDEGTELRHSPLRTPWLNATSDAIHGLGPPVNLPPPRLA